MRVLQSIHLIIGVVGVIAFVLTGQYMAIFLNGLADMADGPRLLYRSAHLYLMWSSLLNLTIGFYFAVAISPTARLLQAIASTLLLAGPPLILAGFFIESPANDFERMFCGWANYFALAGTILHLAASRTPRSATE